MAKNRGTSFSLTARIGDKNIARFPCIKNSSGGHIEGLGGPDFGHQNAYSVTCVIVQINRWKTTEFCKTLLVLTLKA